MDSAAGDADVKAVLLRIDPELDIGRGKVYEIREAIGRIRKAGKPVYAELTSADAGQYLLAAACDQIIMAPSGMLMVPGVRAEMTFYKGLLDKLGVQFDVLQMGKYKGAGEPFTRTEHEPAAAREHRGDGRRHLRATWPTTVAKDRKLEDYEVKTLIDQGLFTATAAKKAGLVDQLALRRPVRGLGCKASSRSTS